MLITPFSLSKFFLVVYSLAIILSLSLPVESHYNEFLQCLSLRFHDSISGISSIVYAQNETLYSSVLRASIKNMRFISAPAARPQVIVTPVEEIQVPPIVTCAQQNRLLIRIRSGGHDYEGLSYSSKIPFVIIDLFNLNNISIDAEHKTAWVQTGATTGQLYYALSQKSDTLGFPAGGCLTVGVGGLFSGGGYGALLRKHGLAADNIIDARIVDANGRMLNRKSMGEDVFWAIRGGGGASFGVITAWKLRLVDLPKIVTLFSLSRTSEQNATELVHKWQYVAPFISKDILIATIIVPSDPIQVIFNSMFLGGVNQLLELMEQRFPELGLRREDCKEVSYAQSTLFFGGQSPDQPLELLAQRNPQVPSAILAERFSFKAKLDYVHTPIPKHAFKGMWKLLAQRTPTTAQLVLIPYGGRMSEISESAIPFPHRAGTLYAIQSLAFWNQSGTSGASLSWARRFHSYLTPLVSKSPRRTYLNYRDLDLGVNQGANTSYEQASKWGLSYFKHNFERLVRVKTKIDPNNFFRNEQSIPTHFHSKSKN